MSISESVAVGGASIEALAADARLVVESCLSVERGETVTVVFDATHEPQARAVAQAAN